MSKSRMTSTSTTQRMNAVLSPTSLLIDAAVVIDGEISTDKLIAEALKVKDTMEEGSFIKHFFVTNLATQDDRIAQLKLAIANEKQTIATVQAAIDEVRQLNR